MDREVAHYMRDNVRPAALPGAVYLLEEFLEGTTDPLYCREFVHGRPMKTKLVAVHQHRSYQANGGPHRRRCAGRRVDGVALGRVPIDIALSCNGHARTEA